MADDMTGVSDAFKAFLTEAPQHAQAWMAAVQALDGASALDEKTGALAYLAVLAVLRLESGVHFHVQAAKRAGDLTASPANLQPARRPYSPALSLNRSTQLMGMPSTCAMRNLASIMFACPGWLMA